MMSFDPCKIRHPEDSNQKNIDSKYNVAVLVTGDVGAYRIPRYTQAAKEEITKRCYEQTAGRKIGYRRYFWGRPNGPSAKIL
jgi:hypothetical protein